MRALGYEVANDCIDLNSWYFRNALLRANYNDLKNLLYAEKNELKNSDLHDKITVKCVLTVFSFSEEISEKKCCYIGWFIVKL